MPLPKTAALQGERPKSVQEYIDETPFWPDGTALSITPMTAMQWRVWFVAAAGKFFEGLVVFMTGVALPLIVLEFNISPFFRGAVSAAPLFGILVGATALGGLADHYGRKRMFIAEMILFTFCLGMIVLSPNLPWLLVFSFGMGAALGCDYPTAHLVISESIPSRDRGKLVIGAFAFQALGALMGTGIGYVILKENPSVEAWRLMYATAIPPALLVIAARFRIPDSGHWLMLKGRVEDAERAVSRLLERRPPYPKNVVLGREDAAKGHRQHGGYAALFSKKNRRATLFASLPWFLQDIGTYGIGIFTPVILLHVLGTDLHTARNLTETVIREDMMAAKGAAILDLLLLAGILTAVPLADKLGRVRLQAIGFVGCAVGLFLASLAGGASEQANTILIFAGFMIFNFMDNLGPNSMSYLIAGEVFPTAIRGKGAGFAASFAKLGAVATAFLFPVLIERLGTNLLLSLLVGTSLLGAALTWFYGIETKGLNLETIGREHAPDPAESPPRT